MKILFVCDKLITFILNDISELSKLNHEVTILSLHRDKRIYEKIVYPYLVEHGLEKRFFINWNVHRGRKDKLLSLLRFIKLFFFDFFKNPVLASKCIYQLLKIYDNLWVACSDYNYLRILLDKKYDVIHSPFSTPSAINTVYFLAKILNVPYTLSFRAHDLYIKNDFNKSIDKRNIIEQACSIFTISNYNKQLLQNHLGKDKKINVIHAGVETDFFRPYSGDRVKNRIISIGRFHEQKGLIYLLQACKILRDRNLPFECVLIGEGPERDSLVDFVNQHHLAQVTFIDYLDRDDIKKALAQSEIFVLPCIVANDGTRDILANSLKEAMAMELPVITSSISGVQELVVDGHNGILTNPKDPLAIADAIEKLLTDSELRNQMGKAARKHILEHFNVNVEAKKLEAIFQEAAYK